LTLVCVSAILAFVQASSASKQVTDEAKELTGLLGSLCKHLMVTNGREVFQVIDEMGLSFTQIKLAQHLAEAEAPLSLGTLGEHLDLSLPAVSRAVDGLVKRGIVTREEDPADRRSKRVVITRGGRRLYDRIYAIRLAGVRSFVDELDPDQRDALLNGLRPIVSNLP
jgi:DNA-binding MarR family transcriptional regulator